MDSQDYLEIKVNVPDEETGDIVVASLGELGFDAFYYEDGVQKCYIQTPLFDETAFNAVLADIRDFMGVALESTVRAMPKENWNSTWEKEGFTPIECGDYIVVPYGSDCDTKGKNPILMHAQMAFGTGHHHTTFMMMQAMQDCAPAIKDAAVTDLGCGTAVLAILAAKLGAADILAIDINEVAVRSALENIALNGLDFPAIAGDAGALDEKSCAVLLANIHRNILIADMDRYAAAVKKGGLLFVSGFLEEDLADILSCAQENGFEPCRQMKNAIRTREGWHCVVLERI